jgi:hypothetical protein
MKKNIYLNFFVLTICFFYIYISKTIIKLDLFEDFLTNIKQITSLNDINNMPSLAQPYYYFQYTLFYLVKDPIFVQIFTASISLSIYVQQFLKSKNYLFLINFLLLPITPVFFLSINRFALSSAILLVSFNLYEDKKALKKDEISLKKIILYIISFFIHIGPTFILIISLFNKNTIPRINSLLKNIIKKFGIYITLIMPILSIFFLIIITLLFDIEFKTSQLFYQFRFIYKYFNNIEFDFLQTIFILPICYLFTIFKAIGNKYNYKLAKFLLINISLLSFLSSFIPLLWRYWIMFMPLVFKLEKNNNFVINIILLFYSFYLFPIYINF